MPKVVQDVLLDTPAKFHARRQTIMAVTKLSTRLPKEETPAAMLDALQKMPPATIDCDLLRKYLEEAEASGADHTLLQRGLIKLEYAERVQAAARVKALTEQVDGLLSVPDLDLDVEKLLQLLRKAEDAGVPDAVLDRGQEKLDAADRAQEERRQELRAAAAEQLRTLSAAAPLLLGADGL